MTTNDVSDTKISTERLDIEGYRKDRGPEWCAIFDTLRNYRLSNMTFEGSDDPFCLVDLVSTIGEDISTGEWELLQLADEIHIAQATLASRHQEPVSEPGEQKRYLKDGPVLRLVRLRFFRDMVQSERVKVYEVFGIDKDDLPNPLTLGIEQQVFDQLFVRRAASLPKVETGVRVKPLEWVENVAETAIGAYWIIAGIDSRCTLGLPIRKSGDWPKYPTPEAAKAAAQADYEQRIKSALETPPLHKEGEAVAYTDPRAISALRGTPAQKVYLTKTPSPAYSMPLYAAPVPVPLEDGQVEIIEQSDTPDGGTALTLRQYDQETVVVAYFPPVLPPVPVPVTITDEMVLAPKEPTEEMHNAARDWSVKKYGLGIGRDASDGCYKAMIAALSQKPGEQG